MSALSRLICRLQPSGALLLFAAMLVSANGGAAPLTLATAPLYTASAVKPQVMIDMSKDQQLFYKAYNDYSDLLGDGVIQTTYTNTVNYYGYFDSAKCYDYKIPNGRFEPVALTTTHYCDGYWSGNFLNWATMSRLDAVRKLLYGGMRSTDNTDTVLERSFETMDAHAWAKYYNGNDLSKLTPFNVEQTFGGTKYIPNSLTIEQGDISLATSWDDVEPGDQVRLDPDSHGGGTGVNYMVGTVVSSDTNNLRIMVPGNGIPNGARGTYSGWTLTNLTRTGVTLCNVTPKDPTAIDTSSQSNNAPPQIRVARGNYSLWASHERWQCVWAEEVPYRDLAGYSNSNQPLISHLNASSYQPSRAKRGLNTPSVLTSNAEYIARVLVCKPDMLGDEKCKRYPAGTYKPIGLLHTYGDSDSNLMQFGLMTGSYQKNISGGVLRRNVGDFSSEVDSTRGNSRGIFTSVKGIVYNMNRLRMYGYNYADGTYIGDEKCNFQTLGLVPDSSGMDGYVSEGNCSSWGNPMSGIFLESLRYFAGKQPNPKFTLPSGSKDEKLGLTAEAWRDPLTPTNYCSALNTLVFNPSVSSYDHDPDNKIKDIGSLTQTAADLTNTIGQAERINGKWFVGSIGGTPSSTDGQCTAKTITSLGSVSGLCPEGPETKGTYEIAGTAWYAHTNRIRSGTDRVAAAVPTDDTKSLKVTTYAIQLSTNTPKININVKGKSVVLLPAYRVNAGGRTGVYSSGTLVDFKIIEQTSSSGSFYVNWDDSSQGGDFDQDVWGILSYEINGGTLKVTTAAVGASAPNAQGFGYIISGTDKDGPHFHSGINAFSYSDPTNVTVTPRDRVNTSGGCKECQLSDGASTASYQITGAVASQLKDPLYYAAKWGGFIDKNASRTPDMVSEWDTRSANGVLGTDGTPDNYFYVTNPAALETSLQRTFQTIIANGSSASVASSSTSLNSGTHIYQARFNSLDWSGQLLDFAVNQSGVVSPDISWDAGDKLFNRSPASRVIITYNGLTGVELNKGGIAFKWTELPPNYQNALNINFVSVNDGLGESRLNWIRGDRSLEGTTFDKFRIRNTSTLGDIVNSNPQFVGAPSGGYFGADYQAFSTKWKYRLPIVYVGSNDGMLHGFSATDGSEKLAFIPSRLIGELSGLPDKRAPHKYRVDGTPVVRDAVVSGEWKTVLVGSLGGGGPSIFALDVTDPSGFSENNAAKLVLWEFTDNVDRDLGYTFGQPSIVKMADERWAAVFGNGYNNKSSGKAFLYIVFLDRPAGKKTWTLGVDYLKLATDDPSGTIGSPGTPNGLSEPLPVDYDGDGKVDAVFAGDLLGNMWKFAVDDRASSTWGPATLLYKARSASGSPQPITSAPDVIKNSAVDSAWAPVGGFMVTFGTGRYLQVADAGDTSPQTFYGIWDQRGKDGTITVTDRLALVKQTILGVVTPPGDLTAYRLTSNNEVNYPTQKGWYLDLPTPGERVVFNPVIRNGRVIFTTVIPAVSPCSSGGEGWLMELNPVNGSRLASTPFDVNKDGIFSPFDNLRSNNIVGVIPVSGRRSTVGMPSAPTILSAPLNREYKIMSGSKGTIESVLESAPGIHGRDGWREIMR